MQDKNSSILIIGAGLGGLALAQGLIKAGFNVTVFERDESPASRPQGYRISIRSQGMSALKALLTPEKLSRLSKAKVADVGDGFTCANEKMGFFKKSVHPTNYISLMLQVLKFINTQWEH